MKRQMLTTKQKSLLILKIVSALKENSKQTMDSIYYTTNKEYTDGTTLVEVKLYI
jgi:hypothetical protein